MTKYIAPILILTLLGLAVSGWVLNIIKLFSTTVMGEAILRTIGVFVAPLGAIFGYL